MLLGFLVINCAGVIFTHAQGETAPVAEVEAAAEGQGLTFETKLREVTTKPETKVVKVEYAFTNNTANDITIVEYDAPCTCFSARLRRPDGKQEFTFKPGEKGVLIGALEFENFKGTIDKKIWVRTSDDAKDKPSIILTARVTIPTLISPDKAALEWDVGGALEAQVFHIKVDHTEPIKIVKHSMGFGAEEHFDFKMETILEGADYKVTVIPKKTDTPMLGALRFYTDSPMQRYKMVQVFLNVSKKKEKKP